MLMSLSVDGPAAESPDGTNAAGSAEVTHTSVLKSAPLIQFCSAKAAELFALTEACKSGMGRNVALHTDSRYPFSVVHVFVQQWKSRNDQSSPGPAHLCSSGC